MHAYRDRAAARPARATAHKVLGPASQAVIDESHEDRLRRLAAEAVDGQTVSAKGLSDEDFLKLLRTR